MKKFKINQLTKAGVLAFSAAMLMAGCGNTSSDTSATIKVETLAPETPLEETETQKETVSELTLMMQVNDRIDYAYLEKALTYLNYRYDDVSYIENTPAYDDPEYTILKDILSRALAKRAMQDTLPVYEDSEPVYMGPQIIGDDKLIAVETEETKPEDQDMPYVYYQGDCLDDFMALIGSTKSVAEMGLSWRPEIEGQIVMPASGFGGGMEDYSLEMHSPQVRADGIYVYYTYNVYGMFEDITEERVAKIVPVNTGGLGYKIQWIKMADEAPAAEDVSEQAEPESVYESQGPIEVVSVSEMVEPAREETVDYTDGSGNQYHAVFRIPRILLQSEDAAQINTQIMDELGGAVDEALAARDNGWSLVTTGIDYNAWVWKDTLTVFTTVKTDWDMEMHYIYTLDMQDGHRMDNGQVAALWGKSEDELYATLTDLIQEKFVNMYGATAQMNGDFYDEQLANSTSEENVRASVVYPDSKGSAMADVTIYAMAGANAYEQIIGLGWE